MANSKDSSDDLCRIPVATVYQSRVENWQLYCKPELMLGPIESEFRTIDVPLSLEKQLRHFAVWCARTVYSLNTAELCRVIIDTVERFLADKGTREELERAWDESHRVTAPAGMVGLPHRCTNAAAALACAHAANPNAFAAAKWAAYYAATAQVWDRVKVPDKPRPSQMVWNLYSDGKYKKAIHIGHPDPYHAAERQVHSEIEAAQAEQLRQLLPNPYIELTRVRSAMAEHRQQDSDREQFREESAEVGRAPRWGRGWCVESGDPILYGQMDKVLVFIPTREAERLASIYAALNVAKSWGELRKKLPEGVYADILNNMIEDRGFESFYLYWIEEHSEGTRDQAFEDYQALEFSERLPNDNDAFDRADIPGFCDGDWPDWPQQEMLNWVPQAIQKAYGQVIDSTLNGPFLTFRTEDEKAIVEAFTELGYRCRKDDCWVRQACGHTN